MTTGVRIAHSIAKTLILITFDDMAMAPSRSPARYASGPPIAPNNIATMLLDCNQASDNWSVVANAAQSEANQIVPLSQVASARVKDTTPSFHKTTSMTVPSEMTTPSNRMDVKRLSLVDTYTTHTLNAQRGGTHHNPLAAESTQPNQAD